MSFSDKWPSHRPIANNCSRVHKGFGCGAKNSNHMPKYYNSLCKVYLLKFLPSQFFRMMF